MNSTPRPPRAAAHRGHGWMMMICCVPMLVIAVALVATGAAGASFLFTAVLCTAMMALMMRGMNHAGDDDAHLARSPRVHNDDHQPSPSP